jgi:hypothetical protein
VPEDRGPVLLRIAREALVAPTVDWRARASAHPWLAEPGASFVTLRMGGELRGCIGSIEPRRALGEDVVSNARAAAYRDPRFPPVSPDEHDALQVEVSVLSPRRPLPAATEDDAVRMLRPGIDGVYLEFDGATATFLPQVWEGLADPREFLAQLRRKAGLPAGFWHPGLRLSRYTVEKYA